ncbi:armadillo repeat-containing protein 12 isoform X5 [Mustela nigripes]|uniref:Armadillo repeat-containing protein 12 isoform X4 n=1 Tax=Mustela putorius furo TaxID=9669 RepID=A0A8U0T309_MUSPF|nr:armadillo repeat-containing protein 12 isoform X4 [Mustela putorius furo]XP_059256095.1 armadillo repeat-containing protein 12 isoform X5 [Mustela nigripes]
MRAWGGGLSLRFSRSPRLRWSNELPRGPRIWFLGRGVIEAHHLCTHCFPTPNTSVLVKPACDVSFVAQVLMLVSWFLAHQSSGSRRPLPGALGLAPTRAQGHTEDMGMSIPQYLGQMDIRKGVVGLATGAGFIYLLYKAIKAGIKCQPPLCTASPICIARECAGPRERALPQEAPAPEASSVGGPKGLAVERERHGRDSGELRRLLNSLEYKQDEYAKSMILHSITRCVYLLEAEVRARKQEAPPSQPSPRGLCPIPTLLAGHTVSWDLSLWPMAGGLVLRGLVDMGGGCSGPRTPASPASSVSPGPLQASSCTADDISLVGSMLDEEDNSVKIQALNTLKAFSGIRKFRLKIQEHTIKVLELISTIWDSELHVAGLRLLNSLPLPDYVHPQLRRVMPALMEILQSNYILAQVQAIRLLSYLAQKNDLLYDILNCQVHSNFLNLFQSTQPGSLLFEVLVFAERLSEGRNSPHYRAVKWHYNEQSLHEALFGDESRLADRLLALVIHPEEEVQIQACKVIVSLQCSQDVGVRPSSCRPSHSYFNSGENN